MPRTIKAHIALSILSFIIQASKGVEGWSETTSQLVLFLWAIALIVLYIVLLQRHYTWARRALAIITPPWGLLLLTESARDYTAS